VNGISIILFLNSSLTHFFLQCLTVRQKDIKRVEEEEKARLIEKVGTKAMELNKAREELAQTQLRKAQAEERLRAHELLVQIHKTIENAFVSSGRKSVYQNQNR